MKLTKPQQAAFWRLFSCASRNMGATSEQDQRDYRHKVLYATTGKTSLTEINRCGEFERVMAALAVDAEDYQAAAKWSTCEERRTLHMIKECARQLGEIQGEPRGWVYCRSIFVQAHLPESWEDIPNDSLWDVFMMIDTHRRRILKGQGWGGPGAPLGFYAPRIFFRSGADISFYDPTTH